MHDVNYNSNSDNTLLDKPLTISEINQLLKAFIRERFYNICLVGEISSFRPSANGHWYFTLKDETSYENIVLTMMHGILSGYRVTSQKESGNGRADLILEPRVEGAIPIIIELKVSDSEDDLDRDVDGAISQIHDRKYYLGMDGDVILIGMAFRGKIVRGRVEKVSV